MTLPSVHQVLNSLDFGESTAEDETARDLRAHFVETQEWKELRNGRVDIVFGVKGAGKSTLHSLLLSSQQDLLNQNVLLIEASDALDPADFREAADELPDDERKLIDVWKLYFLTLIGRRLLDAKEGRAGSSEMEKRLGKNVPSDLLISKLQSAGLLERGIKPVDIFLAIVRFISRAVQVTVPIDPSNPSVGSLSLSAPIGSEGLGQHTSVELQLNDLYRLVDEALGDHDRIWLSLDRLDVAFESLSTGVSLKKRPKPSLEEKVIRALIRTYLELKRPNSKIALKIFLRSDIWATFVSMGRLGESNRMKDITISWEDRDALMALLMKRLLYNNGALEGFYGISETDVLNDISKQRQLFSRMFPEKVDNVATFNWMLLRIADGSGNVAPRDLINLLSKSRERQLRRIEAQSSALANDQLFEPAALKEGLRDISRLRYRILGLEYPDMQKWCEAFRDGKAQFTKESATKIWIHTVHDLAQQESGWPARILDRLVKIGFLSLSKDKGTYSIPYLYRGALDIPL